MLNKMIHWSLANRAIVLGLSLIVLVLGLQIGVKLPVEVLPDLFGDIIVERRWGRIGGRGQFRAASYRSTSLAEAAVSALLIAKERRGYRVAS